MSYSKAPAAYSLMARALHWITAVLVLTTIPIGVLAVNIQGISESGGDGAFTATVVVDGVSTHAASGYSASTT
jgi:cytochrome b561